MLVAGAAYIASLVWLGRRLVRVLLWLLHYRRPELGTETPDGAFTLIMGLVTLAIAPLFVYALVVEELNIRLALLAVIGALLNAFVWVQLRSSFSVALAELRYGQARQRQLKARARGVVDPALDRAVDEGEQEYHSTRYWEQGR